MRPCDFILELDGEKRPGNALNIESCFFPKPRCYLKSPDGRGAAWLLSGGDVLAYGVCDADCPIKTKNSEKDIQESFFASVG